MEFSFSCRRIAASLTIKAMYIFVDEAGDLTDYGQTGSNYFIILSVIMGDYQPCVSLMDLRHELTGSGHDLRKGFHAKNDPWPVRRTTFNTISGCDIQIDYVALLKSRIYEVIRDNEPHVYGLAIKFLFNYLFTYRIGEAPDTKIILPEYAEGKKKRRVKETCVEAISKAVPKGTNNQIVVWPSISHPGLQIADYCAWIIQRNLEMGVENAVFLDQIENKVQSSFFPFGK